MKISKISLYIALITVLSLSVWTFTYADPSDNSAGITSTPSNEDSQDNPIISNSSTNTNQDNAGGITSSPSTNTNQDNTGGVTSSPSNETNQDNNGGITTNPSTDTNQDGTVIPTVAPTISSLNNKYVMITDNPTATGTTVTFNNPDASSTVSSVTINCIPSSNSFFPVGTTQVICTATDIYGNSASSTFNVTVINNTSTSTNSTDGSSGGSSSGSSFSGGGSSGGVSTNSLIAGVIPNNININSCPLLTSYLGVDVTNNKAEVYKLQAFLRNNQGYNYVQFTGVYDQNTITAVKAFQAKYLTDIMGPWQSVYPSGIVYITTRNKINQIACQSTIVLTADQQAIIDAYNQTHGQNGTETGSTTPIGPSLNGENGSITPVIGENTNGSNSNDNSNNNTASVGNSSILQRIWSFIKGLFGR